MTDMKYCGGCKRSLQLDEFHRNIKRPDGCAVQCKSCVNAYHAARYAENPAKYLKKNAEWRKKNPEKAREIEKKRVANHRSQNTHAYQASLEYHRMWNAENYRLNAKIFRATAIDKRQELSGSYVAYRLKMPVTDISPDLFELKREQLRIYRLTKQLAEALNEATKGEKK